MLGGLEISLLHVFAMCQKLGFDYLYICLDPCLLGFNNVKRIPGSSQSTASRSLGNEQLSSDSQIDPPPPYSERRNV
jgi:hypothetical protein